MFTKTSIALTIIVAISSGAVAAPKHQNGAGAYGASPVPAPVLRCLMPASSNAWLKSLRTRLSLYPAAIAHCRSCCQPIPSATKASIT